MIVTGIADEASTGIDGQIRAHQELGWNHIELRLIDGKNVAGALEDAAVEAAAEKLEQAGMTVTGLGSAIGNWSRPITGDFEIDLRDLKITVGRMQRLGVKYVRTMSWTQGDADEQTWRDESIRRYKQLAPIAEEAGIYLAYENCTGWASESPQRMVDFLDAVNSPHVVMLYDLGNVTGHGDANPLGFYETIRGLPKYVHIKDAKLPTGGDCQFTYPGEGDAHVPQLLQQLAADGYDGVVSIEPHIATVIHTGGGEASEEEKYAAYIKYGRMAAQIVDDIAALPR